jgi:hypothetical protein
VSDINGNQMGRKWEGAIGREGGIEEEVQRIPSKE